MFAYCGNNPINNSDCSGYISEKTIYPVHYDNEQSAREDFVWVPYNGEPHPIDEFIFELTSSANPIDYLMTYEEIENLSGGISLASGVKHIRQGFMLILIPMPSLADELVGVTRIMWGFRSVIKGIGQIFGGGEDK